MILIHGFAMRPVCWIEVVVLDEILVDDGSDVLISLLLDLVVAVSHSGGPHQVQPLDELSQWE